MGGRVDRDRDQRIGAQPKEDCPLEEGVVALNGCEGHQPALRPALYRTELPHLRLLVVPGELHRLHDRPWQFRYNPRRRKSSFVHSNGLL